jgi:hypothetical protein
MGDSEEPDQLAEGLAFLTEQLEKLNEQQAKANELAQSQVELTVKTNELLKEMKAGLFFTPPTLKGPPTTQPPATPPPEPAAASPTKRKASLSETAERLKKEGEGQAPEEPSK